MAGPRDEMTAAAVALGYLRASHADRERVIDTLKAAFVQGRLARDEFDARIGQVLTSRTYADLAAVTADIPVRPAGAQPVREPGRARPWRQVSYALKWGAYGFITPAVFAAALAVASLSGSAVIAGMVLLAFLVLVVWVPMSRHDGARCGRVGRGVPEPRNGQLARRCTGVDVPGRCGRPWPRGSG